jgi:hypothetical protein
MPSNEEWFGAAAICLALIVVFGVIEALSIRRPKRAEAIARRSKARSGRDCP